MVPRTNKGIYTVLKGMEKFHKTWRGRGRDNLGPGPRLIMGGPEVWPGHGQAGSVQTHHKVKAQVHLLGNEGVASRAFSLT